MFVYFTCLYIFGVLRFLFNCLTWVGGVSQRFGCLFLVSYLFLLLFGKSFCGGGCPCRQWREKITFANQSLATVWIDLSYRLHFCVFVQWVLFLISFYKNENILPYMPFGIFYHKNEEPKSILDVLLCGLHGLSFM